MLGEITLMNIFFQEMRMNMEAQHLDPLLKLGMLTKLSSKLALPRTKRKNRPKVQPKYFYVHQLKLKNETTRSKRHSWNRI